MVVKNNFVLLVLFISALFFKEATCVHRKLAGEKNYAHIHVSKKTALFGVHEPQPVTTFCQKTDYSSLCLQSVTPVLHGPVDPIHLLTAEIEATTLKIQKAIETLISLKSDPLIPKHTLSAYDICKSQYDSAIDSLNIAKSAMNSHDIGTLNSELSAVITDAGTCDDTFAEDPDAVSPFVDTDTELSHLGSNCLAISEMIKW